MLGIRDFEDDPDIIETAATHKIEFVQKVAKDDQAAVAQKILNELSTARLCLLSENKKTVYDDALRTPSSAFSNPSLDEEESMIGLVEIDDEKDEHRHFESDDSDEWESEGTYGLKLDGGTSDSKSRTNVLYEPIEEEEKPPEVEFDFDPDTDEEPEEELEADALFDALMSSFAPKPKPNKKKKKRRGSAGSASSKSSPKKPADSVDFGHWKAKQSEAREFIRANDQDNVRNVLNDMAGQSNPQLHRYVGWANRKLLELDAGVAKASEAEIEIDNWVDMAYWKDQQRRVRKLLLEKDTDQAKELLDNMAAQTHPKLHQYVGWANRKLSEIGRK